MNVAGVAGLALLGGALYLATRSRAPAPGSGAAVGDSITAHGGFVEVLNELPGYHWENHGVVGDSTPAILRRADQWARPKYRHFVIMAGLNDHGRLSASSTIANLREIYRRAHQHGARVVALTSTPWRAYRGWSAEAQARQDQTNRWIRSGAEDLVDLIVDIYQTLEFPTGSGRLRVEYSAPDGLHLNAQGQRSLGQLIAARAFH